jgi:hypothetical protein
LSLAAPSQERKKWEKVLEASEAAGKAAEKQVQELTKQVAELRERAAAAEELANNYSGVAVKQEQDLRTRVEVCASTCHVANARLVMITHCLSAKHAGDSALCAGSEPQLRIRIRDSRSKQMIIMQMICTEHA